MEGGETEEDKTYGQSQAALSTHFSSIQCLIMPTMMSLLDSQAGPKGGLRNLHTLFGDP